jgi:Spy/CpxP family protein refolding chaperone
MSTKRFLIVATLLAVAMMAVALAQKTQAMHHNGDMAGMGLGGDHLGFLADYLDLTDAQKQQVQNIFAAEKPKIQPLMADLAAAHKQVQAGIDDGTLDQPAALSIIEAHKSTLAQLLAEHAQVHAQILKVLTPDQQAKFKKMEARHMGHMHGGMGMGGPPPQATAPDQK